MIVDLVDGTYELFRHYFAVPSAKDSRRQEIAAVRGVLGSVVSMLEKGSTHIGVATDHVIESFRNQLYPYYKTGAGLPEELVSQFQLLEDALTSLGVKVWAMVEFEADDALAAAAEKAAQFPEVEQVRICTPDKDLSQCVRGESIVQLDRMRGITRDEQAVVEKFGVAPASIPDYLALIGDSADGFPGIKGWGAKSAASVLSIYKHLENIPRDPGQWEPSIRSSTKLATSLFAEWNNALLFKKLATLRYDVPVFESIDDLRWRGPQADFEATCERLNAANIYRRVAAAQAKLS